MIILCDDMGYSDLGCFGGEIDTPHLDKLAADGIRCTQFYSSPRCAPSRASMLTGLHPHQAGIGILTYDDGPDGYPGNLGRNTVTMAEVLRKEGYRTYLSGKWHLAKDTAHENDTWPLHRGFDRFYGTLAGSGSFYMPHTLMRGNENVEHETLEEGFYYTDAITEHAISCIRDHLQQCTEQPFFQYVAYTAPHWPLQAPEEEIERYRGRFDQGWDQLREERLTRMTEMGILSPTWTPAERDSGTPSWEEVDHKAWRQRCMEVYAAQITRMDRGIGDILAALREAGQLDNTLILFLSDNGGCAEHIHPHPEPGVPLIPRATTRENKPVLLGNHPDVMPGKADTFQTYNYWAYLSNTPFRLYKSWVHEGGIATPLIAHWPGRLGRPGSIRHTPGQLTDLMPTVLEAAGAAYPSRYEGVEVLPLEGRSLMPVFTNDLDLDDLDDLDLPRHLFWEHQGNAAVRSGHLKLVRDYPGEWELYDLQKDRTESCNLAERYPETVAALSSEYEKWAARCRVIPREQILNIPGRVLRQSPYFGWMI
ncbi:arylsulfatase [Paenibacillus cremeus]|uniref:Arylsulfatase n=2 Tax=Paenibacillus cremeus TaxID=2163881 RepID=A0A559KGG9_9BACL|nr:arylsulfatase [Paenibacillus cremeus]